MARTALPPVEALEAEKPVRDGQRTALAIQEAAAELFYAHGYEATSLRSIASAVGIQVGSLYNHMSGKDELLSEIMVSVMQDLLDSLNQAVAEKEDPIERLQAAIACHIRYHAEHRRQVFIGNSELRALSHDDRHKVVSLRRDYEEALGMLIDAAAEEGSGDVLDRRLQVFSIVAIGTHVSTWYRPDRGRSLEDIVSVYTRMIFREMSLDLPDV
jgi:AcrR family transcriptional regulator